MKLLNLSSSCIGGKASWAKNWSEIFRKKLKIRVSVPTSNYFHFSFGWLHSPSKNFWQCWEYYPNWQPPYQVWYHSISLVVMDLNKFLDWKLIKELDRAIRIGHLVGKVGVGEYKWFVLFALIIVYLNKLVLWVLNLWVTFFGKESFLLISNLIIFFF